MNETEQNRIQSKQMFVGWVGNVIGEEKFVVIDSSPIWSHSCNEAERLLAEGRFVHGFVPAVFLDDKLDNPELRSSLQTEAVRRFDLGRARCLQAS